MIESVLNLRQVMNGVELYLPMLRNTGIKLGWMLCGAIFCGLDIALLSKDAAVFLSTIFTFPGAVAAMVGTYGLFNSVSVRSDKNGLFTRRQFFGGGNK